MGYSNQFETINPKEAWSPIFAKSHLKPILERANSLLSKRSLDEIKDAASTADWMISEYFGAARYDYVTRVIYKGGAEVELLPRDYGRDDIEYLLDNWPEHAQLLRPDLPTEDNTSDLDALRENIGMYYLAEDEHFPLGEEYEYFAVLALWRLADAIIFSQKLGHALKHIPSDIRHRIADAPGHFFVESLHSRSELFALQEALEAVCYAEKLEEKKRIDSQINNLKESLSSLQSTTDTLSTQKAKEKISANARRIAMERHKKLDPIRAFVRAEWDNWQAKPFLYTSQPRFAADVLSKVDKNDEGEPIVTVETVVRKWIPRWNKEKSK